MATKLPTLFLRSSRLRCPNTTRSSSLVRLYSTEVTPPPLLTKLKGDMKAAMRAKDTPRLNVVRAAIAAFNNASKTSSPIKTDVQFAALLQKTIRTGKESIAEFQAAGRADLVEKEEAQIQILQEYVQGSGLESLSEEQVREVIAQIVSEVRAQGGDFRPGDVSKHLFSPGGKLHGKMFDQKRAAEMVKEEISR